MGLADIARLDFHLRAWMSVVYQQQDETLGVHALNKLYDRREAVVLAAPEDYLILGSLLSDQSNVMPGWYWFRDTTDPQALLSLHLKAPLNREAVAGALTVLTDASVPLAESVLDAIITEIPRDERGVLGKAVLRYLAAIGGVPQLVLLHRAEFASRPDLAREVADARQAILSRLDPGRAIAEVLQGTAAVGRSLLKLVRTQNESLPIDSLRQLAFLPTVDGDARAALVEVLVQRQALLEPELRRFTADPTPRVRYASYAGLIAIGAVVTPEEIREAFRSQDASLGSLLSLASERIDPDELVFRTLRRLERSVLEAKIKWMELEGPAAYRALGVEHFESFGGQVRSDLRDGFKSLQARYTNEMELHWAQEAKRVAAEVAGKLPSGVDVESVFLSQVREKMAEASEKVDSFIRNRYTEAALEVLIERGELSDAGLARHCLTGAPDATGAPDVQRAAVRLLARVGDAGDASALLGIATSTIGETHAEAIKAAMKLSPGAHGTARLMLESSEPALITAALPSFQGTDRDTIEMLVEPLLTNGDESVRVAGLRVTAETYDEEELTSLLVRYRAMRSYYYNVSCWLDRILYAPGLLRGVFRARLLAGEGRKT